MANALASKASISRPKGLSSLESMDEFKNPESKMY
jgi:hypothetical protein